MRFPRPLRGLRHPADDAPRQVLRPLARAPRRGGRGARAELLAEGASSNNPLEKTAKTRKDIVTAKNLKEKLLEVAPSANEDYFLVPRVVE